jgi:hypothetical protein
VTIIGNGPSSVHVGLVGGVQSILGDLNIENPPSFTTITVDDSTDSAAHTTTLGTFTPAGDTKWGYIRGLAPANINFEYADTNSPLTIETGGDGNVVNVLATGTTTNLVSHGQTTVTVGNSADGVQDILGALNIADPPSFTDVVVYDVADTVGRTATIDSGRVTGLAAGAITYAQSDLSSLTIYGGSYGNIFTIGNTPTNGEFPLYHDAVQRQRRRHRARAGHERPFKHQWRGRSRHGDHRRSCPRRAEHPWGRQRDKSW